MIQRTLYSLLAILVFVPQAVADEQVGQSVIPLGQETAILEMIALVDGAVPACVQDGVQITEDQIRVLYHCGENKAETTLTLLHPTKAQEGDRLTERFALRIEGALPEPVCEAVAAAVRTREVGFTWSEVTGFRGRSPIPPKELGRRTGAAPMFPPEFIEKAKEAKQLYNDSRPEEALEIYLQLARSPHASDANILGMVVASLASTQPRREVVEAYVADADAHPDDPLKHFVAGITAHYSAHYRGKNRENRVWLYNTTIERLERCEDAFPDQPRVYIYQAISHYRLGHQEKAEALIEQAIQISDHDPDGFYCRAEIWHRKDPLKAVQDIDIYLEKIEEIHRQYGENPPKEKVQRVHKMREYLEAVARGEAEYQEIFDPLDPDMAVVAAWEKKTQENQLPAPWLLALVGLGLALTIAVGVRFWTRHRKPVEGPSS